MPAQSLGQEDPLEEGMATHSNILAWRIPMDREAWWATDHRVSRTWTWLKRFSIRHICFEVKGTEFEFRLPLVIHYVTSTKHWISPSFGFLEVLPHKLSVRNHWSDVFRCLPECLSIVNIMQAHLSFLNKPEGFRLLLTSTSAKYYFYSVQIL